MKYFVLISLIITLSLSYDLPACTLHVSKLCDESKNSYGPSKCRVNDDCIA